MHNAQFTQVAERRYELLEQFARFFLLKAVLGRDKTEELAVAAVLHD